MFRTFISLYRTCLEAHVPALLALLRFYYRKRHGVNLLAAPRTEVRGLENLATRGGVLNVGVSYVGFLLAQDRTLLNLRGRLVTHGDVVIGRGCRLDIGPQATVTLGAGTYLTANTLLIIQHGLTVGAGCAIS